MPTWCQNESMLRRLWLSIVLLSAVSAQPRLTTVVGCVTDIHGIGVKYADVEVSPGGGQWTNAARSDQDGCFRFQKPFGANCLLRVYARGFQSTVRTAAAAAKAYDFGKITLEVGALDPGPNVAVETSSVPSAASLAGVPGGPLAPEPSAWPFEHVVLPINYPMLASQALVQGNVDVVCIIAEDGQVLRTEVSSGHPLLRTWAAENAKQWRFYPAPSEHPGLRQMHLIYRFELVGEPTSTPRTEVSIDAPNRILVVSQRPCASDVPCPFDMPRKSGKKTSRP
jgi:hypothetical protein